MAGSVGFVIATFHTQGTEFTTEPQHLSCICSFLHQLIEENEPTCLEFSVSHILHKLLDGCGGEVRRLRSELDHVVSKGDVSDSRALLHGHSEEFENPQAILIIDINVDEDHLFQNHQISNVGYICDATAQNSSFVGNYLRRYKQK